MSGGQVRAGVLVVLVVSLAFAVLGLGSSPAQADHGTVPWSATVPINSDPLEVSPAVLYNGHGVFYFASGVWTYPPGTTNISLEAYATSGTGGYPRLLSSSQVNGNGSSAGTVWPTDHIGLATDDAGRVFVAWGKSGAYTASGSEAIYVSTSPDAVTWADPVLANAPTDRGSDRDPIVRTAPDGRVWVGYEQTWDYSTNVTLAWSTDHGATFHGFANVTNPTPDLLPFGYDFVVDGSGRLHLVYSLCTTLEVCSVWYTTSVDGSSWTPRVELLQGSASGPTHYGVRPAFAFQPPSTLFLAWIDGRQGGTPGHQLIYYTQSPDLGATWTPAVPISQGLEPPTSDEHSLAVDVSGSTVMVAWNSNEYLLSWAVSADGGVTWAPEQFQVTTQGVGGLAMAVDGNGTFAAVGISYVISNDWQLLATFWNGPPDAPTNLAVSPAGAGSLTLSWTAPPQGDVISYHIYRSPDGSTYNLVATVAAQQTGTTDLGLANGTYWYRVTAVDATGHESHASVPAPGTVGPSVLDEINRFRDELGLANATLAAIQTQLNDLKAALGSTTTIIALLIVVIVIQAVMLVVLVRRPKGPAPVTAPATAAAPPTPGHPEDEL